MADDRVLLVSMLEQARLIRDRIATLSREQFNADIYIQLALDKLLQNIGESARLVSSDQRIRLPNIPWSQIVGMRHRLVHEYFRTDSELIWDTTHSAVDDLIRELEPVVGYLLDQKRTK